MSEQAYEQLTLFQEGFLVNHSPLPGDKEAQKMTVTSGRKCLELYKKSGRLGLLARMCLESSIWHSTRCFLTWSITDMKCKHLLFRLVPSTHGINENESVLWPTLTANGMGSEGHQKMLQKLVDKGYITAEERRKMIQGYGGQMNPEWLEWYQGYKSAWTGLIPTPAYSNYKGAPTKRYIAGGGIQNAVARTDRDFPGRNYWENEPDLDRVVDGIPNRMDRIKCLGNAVVPQQFYPFFKAIAEIEEEVCH